MFGLLYKIQFTYFGLWPLFDPRCRVVFIFFSLNKMNCLWFYGVWSWQLHYGSFKCASTSGGLCTCYYRLKKNLCLLILQDWSLGGSYGPSWLGETWFVFEFMWKQRQMQLTGFFWDNNCRWMGFYGNGISDSVESDVGKLCERSITRFGQYEKDKYAFKSWFCGIWTIDGKPRPYHEGFKLVYQLVKIYRFPMTAFSIWNRWCTRIYFLLTDLAGLLMLLVPNIRDWATEFWLIVISII